ncbi:four helix bundle protein [bacterium]|nr:four helix bundle protein [bacterium]
MSIREVRDFQDLIIWQRSFQLAEEIYRMTERFPKSEIYGMTSQLRRSAVSIPANIAEGYGRFSQKDYARFIGIALGSCTELETLLLLSVKVGITSASNADKSLTLARECKRMLRAIRFKLHANLQAGRQSSG